MVGGIQVADRPQAVPREDPKGQRTQPFSEQSASLVCRLEQIALFLEA